MARNSVFSQVQALRPGRSVFDLSYAKKMSGKMGYLYPMMVDECIPGDVFDLNAEAVIRFAPLVAPVLHEIILKADWFFVPYRLLEARASNTDGDTLWERFITGGQNGTDVSAIPRANYVNPPEGGLLDHLGFPPGITLTGNDRPMLYPIAAYNLIYNEYYRDPNLEAKVALDQQTLMTANWDPDYLTRALPWQQRGTAPALPVTGVSKALWPDADFANTAGSVNAQWGSSSSDKIMYSNTGAAQAKLFFGDNTVDLSSATSVNIADLRLAVQLQRWLERNARSGYRYTEFLRAHFGVAPKDDRLARPEYIGGLRQPVVISEVLQTSQSGTTPQGNMAGHGIMAGRHNIGRYHVKEFGLIMCIASVIPRPAYQQGVDRQWLRVSRYDFYSPEFANLSEQAIVNEEVYAQNTSGVVNQTIWGYQGRFDELRTKRDKVAGAFRSSLNYWHLGRIFGSLPALSSTFGHVDPTTITRIFASTSADNIYIHWGNMIRAIRPLPPQSNPGRMDHDFGGY